jgi:hypothetical protein
MSFVRMNPRAELGEFYPPPYDFLAPTCPVCGARHFANTPHVLRRTGVAARRRNVPTPKGMGITTGSTLEAAAGPTAVIPVVGPLASAVLAITGVIMNAFSGCGQTCTLTATEANNIGNMMAENLAEYLAAPVSAATQAEALNNFNTLWAQMESYCSQPSLGAAGQNCLSQRQNGACTYKTSPGGWQQTNGAWNYVYPGANGSGSTCWNYFVGFYDPIANDPRISAGASAVSSVLADTGLSSIGSFLLPAALVLAGIFIVPSILGDL